MPSRERMRTVDLRWSPERIKSFCERTKDWILVLPDQMAPTEVESLYWRQIEATSHYAGLIAEIAGHRKAPRTVLRDVALRFKSSREIMAALATNPSLPKRLLGELLHHVDAVVREHAQYALAKQARRHQSS